jgi:hypothetical protein
MPWLLSSSSTDLILGVPAKCSEPILGVWGAPYTKFRINSSHSKEIQSELNGSLRNVQTFSLDAAVAKFSGIHQRIDNALKKTRQNLATAKQCHTRGMKVPEISDSEFGGFGNKLESNEDRRAECSTGS